MRNSVTFTIAGIAALFPFGVTAAAPTGAPVDATASAAQHMRGKAIYAQSCAACHGADLEGGAAPALYPVTKITVVPAKRPAADLARWIKQNMPKNDPGGLSGQEILDVTAYILGNEVQSQR